MRTQPRDQGGTTTFGASVSDAASGSGVAQPGAIPFTFTRTGTGQYTANFDTRLIPTAVLSSPWNGSIARISAYSPGTFTMLSESPPGTLVNASWRFSVTAIDKRT